MTGSPLPKVLSVERVVPGESGGPPVTVRLSVTVEGSEASPSGTQERELLADLLRELDRRIRETPGLALPPGRIDRPLAELIETYRPRQEELVDLLAQEGEISPAEADLLRAHLRSAPPGAAAPAVSPERTEAPRPSPAPTIANDRAPATPRPVGELLDRYEIRTLKQAGAVRARRQISFEEYMALKRHFAQHESTNADSGTAAPSS